MSYTVGIPLISVVKILRVHELANELGMSNQETLDLCVKLGIGVKTQTSTIIEQLADRVRVRAKREGLARDTQTSEARNGLEDESTISFNELARELLITHPELVVQLYKLGILVTETTSCKISLVNADAIRETVSNSEVVGSKSAIKKVKSKPPAQKNGEVPVTISELANYYKVPTGAVEKICSQNGFFPETEDTPLTRRQVLVVKTQLLASSARREPIVKTPLAYSLGKVLTTTIKVSNSAKKVLKPSSTKPPTKKRVSAIAMELETNVQLMEWLCETCNIPTITGEHPKIDIRFEKTLKTSYEIWSTISSDREVGGEVRVSKIAKHLGVKVNDILRICNREDIAVRSERFVSVQSELNLLTVLEMSGELSTLPKNEELLETRANTGNASTKSSQSVKTENNYIGLVLTRQSLRSFSFRSAQMQEVNLSYSDVTESDFSDANLRSAILQHTTAVDTKFVGANLQNVNAVYANFSNADMTSADLSSASLRKANLSNATLRGINLEGCELTGANLSGADLELIILKNTIWTNGQVINSIKEIKF